MAKTFIADYLSTYFDEVEPFEFYRALFPDGELESEELEQSGITKEYNAIAVVIDGDKTRRQVIHNDLKTIQELTQGDKFTIVRPISYAGYKAIGTNARYIYALAIDVDGIDNEQYLWSLFNQTHEHNDILPKPTYVVASGNGVHLYYQFIEPVPCFENITIQLFALKKELTRLIWNRYNTSEYKKPQYQGIFQGFRMVGAITKDGNARARAFETGDKVSIEYLNNFVNEPYMVSRYVYKKPLSITGIPKRSKKHKRKGWVVNVGLYNWWLEKIMQEAQVGHRYFCVMCLCICGIKCNVPYEKVKQDAMSLIPLFDKYSPDNNKFTERDVLASLRAYQKSYITFPRESISKVSGIEIKPCKRNGNTRNNHLEHARLSKKQKNNKHEWWWEWQNKNGAPTKQELVREYRTAHPEASISKCARELGISRNTARKWWN